jgi:hypoxanthine phosphoribosyltransferase
MKVWREYQRISSSASPGRGRQGGAVAPCSATSSIKLSTRHNGKSCSTRRSGCAPTDDVIGKRVLLVDDMTVRMRTLNIARDAILAHGAQEVRTATLMVHGISQRPDWWALETDALILTPWDVQVIEGDGWIVHPEFAAEAEESGLTLPMDL